MTGVTFFTFTTTVSLLDPPSSSVDPGTAERQRTGLGTEVMLFGNVFARAEWEYIRFTTVKNMPSNMNSGRLGVGYKF